LFGLLAVEIAVEINPMVRTFVGVLFFVIGCVFVLRSFYGMRIGSHKASSDASASQAGGGKNKHASATI
jgi:hypothetical protein